MDHKCDWTAPSDWRMLLESPGSRINCWGHFPTMWLHPIFSCLGPKQTHPYSIFLQVKCVPVIFMNIIWCFSLNIRMFARKCPHVMNLSCLFPEISIFGGFLSHRGTPNHPKSEHFSIETHGDLGYHHFRKPPGLFLQTFPRCHLTQIGSMSQLLCLGWETNGTA